MPRFVDFKGRNVEIAKGQTEYETIFGMHMKGEHQSVITKIKFSQEELDHINETGHLWFKFLTFGNKFQPLRIVTNVNSLYSAIVLYKNGFVWESDGAVISQIIVDALKKNHTYFEGKLTVDGSFIADPKILTILMDTDTEDRK